MRVLFYFLCVVLIIYKSVFACNEDNLSLLNTHQKNWNTLNWEKYSYVFKQQCFCPIEYNRAIRIDVSNESIVTAHYVDDGKEVSDEVLENIETIEGLFLMISDAIKRNPDKICCDRRCIEKIFRSSERN